MRDISSYFFYLYGFLLTLISSRTVQFSVLVHVSNLIRTFQTDWWEYSTQSSIVIYNSCSTDYPLSCLKEYVNNDANHEPELEDMELGFLYTSNKPIFEDHKDDSTPPHDVDFGT